MPDALRETVSASQSAALFESSPYLTRRSLYDFFHDGLDVDEKEDESMKWGKAVQAFILDRTARKLNLDVIPNDKDQYVRHPSEPIGATIDAHLICPSRGYGIVEAKSLRWQIHKEQWSDGPPIHIETQLQTQLAIPHPVYGLPQWGVVAAMIGANEDFILYPARPNEAVIARIVEESKLLLDDVKNNRPPPVMGTPIELRGLDKKFPVTKPSEKYVDMADTKLAQMMVDYDEAKQRASFYEKSKDALKTKIVAITKDASLIRVCGAEGKVSRSFVPPSIMSLPGPVKAALMRAADMLKTGQIAGEDQSAIAAVLLDISRWELQTKAGHVRTSIDVTPRPDDPNPVADDVSFLGA